MSINWPYLDPTVDIKTLVGEQVTEKSEIVSVKVKFLKGGVDLKTYAGGSDISYQLLKRSSPEYRAAYMELLLSGYNYVTDFRVRHRGRRRGDPPRHDHLGPGRRLDVSELRHALFGASLAVRTATGQPASVVIASDDVFLAIAGLDGLYPAPVRDEQRRRHRGRGKPRDQGRRPAPDRQRPVRAGRHAASLRNGRGAKWIEDGPYTATAEDAAKLGQDNAIWGMGAPGVFSTRRALSRSAPAVPSPTTPTRRRRRRASRA